MSTDSLDSVKPDEWTRFDLWAQRAHEAAETAITAEKERAGSALSDCTGPLTDAYNRAADVYRDLASASAPAPTPPQPAAIPEPADLG